MKKYFYLVVTILIIIILTLNYKAQKNNKLPKKQKHRGKYFNRSHNNKNFYIEENQTESQEEKFEKKLYDYSGLERDDNPDQKEFTEKIHTIGKTNINIEEVREKASKIRRPYSNEKEKKEVLEKLNLQKDEFKNLIHETKESINEAIEDGTRSDEEIKEAQEALAEYEKGVEFINQRIKMVEDDDFE